MFVLFFLKSFESMTVSMIGRDTKVLEELFMEAYRLYQEAGTINHFIVIR